MRPLPLPRLLPLRAHCTIASQSFKLLKIQSDDPASAEEAELHTASVCTYCPAMFDSELHAPSQICTMCRFGQLE